MDSNAMGVWGVIIIIYYYPGRLNFRGGQAGRQDVIVISQSQCVHDSGHLFDNSAATHVSATVTHNR